MRHGLLHYIFKSLPLVSYSAANSEMGPCSAERHLTFVQQNLILSPVEQGSVEDHVQVSAELCFV